MAERTETPPSVEASTQGGSVGKSVVMMLWNTGENDSRVLKEATSLLEGGYAVSVVCLAAPHLPEVEDVRGVKYVRVFRALHPMRARIDSILRTVALTIAVVGAALATTPVLAFGWWLGRSDPGPVTMALVALGLFLLGVAFRSVVRPRRALVRARIFLSRRVFGGLRSFILGRVYKVLASRLVFLTMGESVRALAPDVIHAHDLQTLPAAARLAAQTGARLVYDTHELALEVSNRPRGLHRLQLARQERRSIKRAQAVITVSEGIADRLTQRYGIARPVVLYNSPPVADATAIGRDVRSDLGLAESVPLVLYVGAPSQHRGLEVLIDALALLPEFHLACVGPRRDEWEIDLYDRARPAGAHDRLHFLEPLPIHELLPYLSSADVGVIAYQNVCLNHEYCMPNKLFETVLAGVPIVVANLRDLRTFVEGHHVGCVADETDPGSLASAIRTTSGDPTLRPEGERLRELQEAYGWEAQGARLRSLYAEVGFVVGATVGGRP